MAKRGENISRECKPETALIERMAAAGISRRDLVNTLHRPAGTINCWLAGYNPTPPLYRHLINVIIDKAEKAAAK